MPPLRTDRSADAALIERTRNGDGSAYAELWERHSASARTVARSYSSLDPATRSSGSSELYERATVRAEAE